MHSLNELFEKSFTFEKNLKNKACYLLSNKTPYFKMLPTLLIYEIFKILAFVEKGFYYYVADLSKYPNKINRYIGKCCEIKDDLFKISYMGWNDEFNEWVPRKNITYLDKIQYPKYSIGGYLDILHDSSVWFQGIIININKQQRLTVIYKIKTEKRYIMVKNIPLYYKYIAPHKRHTFTVWRTPREFELFNIFNRPGYVFGIRLFCEEEFGKMLTRRINYELCTIVIK